MNAIQRTLQRIDAFQQRRKWLAFPFAVVKKFGDDRAGNLAALIAYYGFFSLFPLLLVMVSVLGFILRGHPDLQSRIDHENRTVLRLHQPYVTVLYAGILTAAEGHDQSVVSGIRSLAVSWSRGRTGSPQRSTTPERSCAAPSGAWWRSSTTATSRERTCSPGSTGCPTFCSSLPAPSSTRPAPRGERRRRTGPELPLVLFLLLFVLRHEHSEATNFLIEGEPCERPGHDNEGDPFLDARRDPAECAVDREQRVELDGGREGRGRVRDDMHEDHRRAAVQR